MPVSARNLGLVAFGGPVALGLYAGIAADHQTASALLLVAEPLLMVATTYLLLTMLAARRWGAALLLLSGSVLAALVVHLPITPTRIDDRPTPWADMLRECAALPPPSRDTVRVLVQSDPDADDAAGPSDLLVAARPDLVILPRAGDGAIATTIAAGVGGAARTELSADLAVVVRGRFDVCRGAEESWTMALDGPLAPRGALAVFFPNVDGAGVIPLVAVRLQGAGPPTAWFGWPTRLLNSGRAIAAVVAAIGSDRTLVVGDFAAPPTFRHFGAQLMGAGLQRVELPPTWPGRWGRLPLPAMHQYDQIWAADGWRVAARPTLPPAESPRRAVLADLAPQTIPDRSSPRGER